MGTSTVKSTAGFLIPTTTTEKPRQLIYPINSIRSKKNKGYFRRKVTTEAPVIERKKSDVRESSSSSSIVNVAVNNKYSKDIDEMNNLDYGLMTMSAAGEGNNKTNDESNSNKDESKKTLSDQIAEGKYGLIEKELFSKTPKSPGIISYKVNSETPNDNDQNFGGLSKDEIWLSVDHLLVLKGGITNEKANDEDWKPIDDYEAPKRPVKIPINPRVPPPFPVQLADNGPLQFIGNNQFSLVNTFSNETGLFNNEKGTTKTNGIDKTNIFTGYGSIKNFTKDQIHDVIPPPPWLYNNNKDDILKQFPFNLPLPNVDPLNKSDEFDEDDPALFYPPPYSFVYHVNYTNLAPVGPLVPGIILPPPPNFFSVYHPEQDRKPIKTPIDVLHRIQDNQLKSRLTTSSPLPPPSTSSPVAVIPLREVVRKSKVSPSQTPKIKSTTTRTTIYTSTTTPPNTVRKAVEKQKFDTTTLKLHPVYVPASVTTKLYSTTTPKPTVINNQIYKNNDYGSQKHPIYFEYFDARTSNPIKPPYIQSDYDSKYTNPSIYTQTTPTPIYKETIKAKKPKTFYTPQFISTTISPASIDTKYLYVTAKPENIYVSDISSVKPYPSTTEASSISYNSAVPQKPLKLKPVKFDEEIDAIRQTLDFYGGNKYNFPQKKPKVKAIYEFSFEANQPIKHEDNFQPILSYDQKTQNYYTNKPEINYKDFSELIKYNNDNKNKNSYYQSTTEIPIQYYRAKQAVSLPQKNSDPDSSTRTTVVFGQKIIRPQNANYYVTNKMPWLERPIYKEISTQQQQQQQQQQQLQQQQQFQQQQPQKIISYQPSYEASLPTQADNYRINNRNIKYRKPVQHQHQQQQQHHQQQQQYGSEIASLVNDTLVNYSYPQRPINPYSEFIDISRIPPQNQPISHPPPPPPQYQPYPFFNQRPNQQLQQQYHHVPLDVIKFNSNFEYPLPQINPESVSITFYNRPMQKVSPNNNYYVTPRN